MRITEKDIIRTNIQLSLKGAGIRQKDVAKKMGVTPQDLNNIISGYKSSLPSKGYPTYEAVIEKVISILGKDYKEHVKR